MSYAAERVAAPGEEASAAALGEAVTAEPDGMANAAGRAGECVHP